jgi:hypothetical protein
VVTKKFLKAKFEVPYDFMSQKLKKLQRAESLPFCPTYAAFFL